MAFVKYEGVLLSMARQWYPQLVSFGNSYPSMLGLNWNGREIDRRLLVGFDRPAWDSTARMLQTQLTDSAIDSAIAAMPEPFVRENGRELRRALTSRRDHLRDAAAEFYSLLAREVDFGGTDRPDLATVTHLDDGTVEVSVDGDGDLDVIRDTVVDLGLPLHRLSTRVGTLDDVFLQRAQATPA
jgi:hypothetical protein